MEILVRNRQFWFSMFFKGLLLLETAWNLMNSEGDFALAGYWILWFSLNIGVNLVCGGDFVRSIWPSRLMKFVICKVAPRRPRPSPVWVIWGPEVHCGGKGVTNKVRKGVLARDLTRPGTEAQWIFIHMIIRLDHGLGTAPLKPLENNELRKFA